MSQSTHLNYKYSISCPPVVQSLYLSTFILADGSVTAKTICVHLIWIGDTEPGFIMLKKIINDSHRAVSNNLLPYMLSGLDTDLCKGHVMSMKSLDMIKNN